MGTIVEVTIPTEQFALGETFEAVPDVEFESLRVVAHDTGQVLPLLWASAPDGETLDAALEADSTTESVARLVTDESRTLYRMKWQGHVRAVVYVLLGEEGAILNATARAGRWTFRLVFLDHDAASETYDLCQGHGIDLSVRRVKDVRDVGESIDHERVTLSEKQFDALTAAFEMDYYAVPRGMTLEELATTIGVSHQALSERLRRAHQTLISNTLYDTANPVTIDPS